MVTGGGSTQAQGRSAERSGLPGAEALADVLVADPGADGPTLVEHVRRADPLASTVVVGSAVDRALRRAGGLGPVEALLGDPAVSEVMVNGPGPVWVDRWGSLEATPVTLGPADVALLIERILDPLGLRVDRARPFVDARLADGSRVNVIVPPLALDGPTITIRRFSPRPVPLDGFAGGDDRLAAALRRLVEQRATVLVVGATGAGKTTLLNALAGAIHPGDRVITIEDTAELRLPGPHVVRLEGRPASAEGIGAVSLRDLVRNALRMRPDRLVIGEVRGPEALDLILALTTGHRGSMATCHANGPRGGLRRLETLSLLGGVDLPAVAVRTQLAGAVDVVVHVDRVGAERRVVEVAAVDDDLGPGERLVLHRLWPAGAAS